MSPLEATQTALAVVEEAAEKTAAEAADTAKQSFAITNETGLVDSLNAILNRLPLYSTLKNLDREEKVKKAAADWFCRPLDCLNAIAAALNAAMSLAEVVSVYAPYIMKVRDLAKKNAAMEEGEAGRKTWRDLGIIPNAAYKLHGKEIVIKEDDPISWYGVCAQVFHSSPQYVNRKVNDTIRPALPAFTFEEEKDNSSSGITPLSTPTGDESMVRTFTINAKPDAGDEMDEEDETPVSSIVKPVTKQVATMPVPEIKPGDVDGLISFLAADGVTNAVTPLDAVFGEVESDFQLAQKLQQFNDRIIAIYCTKLSVIKVKVTCTKVKQVAKDQTPEETQEIEVPFTQVAEAV